jgi:hypothetical protein
MDENEMMEEQMNQTEGNLNQPPQQPGGPGGETQMAAMAEPQSPEGMQMGMEQPTMAAPEGVNPNTIPAQPNMETGQMGYIPQSLRINPDIQDPDIQAIANDLFNGGM